MYRSILYLFLLMFLSWSSSAQDCPKGFYLLRNDTIFELSQQMDGQPNFVPYYQADFLDSIGALAYHSEENYWYGVSFINGVVLKFKEDGRTENLGRPQHEKSGSLMPNEELTSAVVWEDKLYILSYALNSIFEVDLSQKPLTYKNIATFKQSLPNSLSYDPNSNRLLVFHQNGGSIYLDPENGKMEIDNGKYKGFKRRGLVAYGKLWFDSNGQAIMLYGNEGKLVHLDLEEKAVYDIAQTGFASPRDAAQCFGAKAPIAFPQDLLNMRVFSYHSGPALQIEWMQGENHELEAYELQANRSDGRGWVKIQRMNALNAYQQSGRHASLDRYLKTGEHCYRLRLDYVGGHSRYSPSICMNWPDSLLGSGWDLSPQFVSPEWPYVQLQTQKMAEDQVLVRLYRLLDGAKVLEKAFLPKGEAQRFLLALPAERGWYRAEVISGSRVEEFSVYVNR